MGDQIAKKTVIGSAVWISQFFCKFTNKSC